MVFTAQCPQCGKILWYSDKLAGTVTICPACGGMMRLPIAEAPPPIVPDPSINPAPAEDRAPAEVEQTYLTHQAAAAVGEVQMDVEDSDLVQWAQPQSPPAAEPPTWAPPPLVDQAPAANWPPHSNLPPRDSYRNLPTVEERKANRKWILQVALCAVAVFLFLLGLIWLFTPPKNPSFDQVHRQEILDLKQSAEDLALQGKYRDAYDQYEALERLVAGQQINDPYLQSELETAWKRRDDLYELALRGGPAASRPNEAPAIPVNPESTSTPPIVAETEASPVIAPEITQSTTAPSTSPSFAQSLPPHPAPHPTSQPSNGVTDDQIGAAITKGASFLMAQFTDSQIGNSGETQYHDGLDCLAVYALMQSGLATNDQRLDIHGTFMSGAIDAMKQLHMVNQYITYSRALRATALALYDRDEDHATIRDDVGWLMRAQYGGAYTYTDRFLRNSNFPFWDNSNSQYGLLGVWSGAEVGIVVPDQYWKDVEQHWTDCQLNDGEWAYRAFENEPRRSMTLAGIASLFVTQDYLDPARYGDQVGRPPFQPALAHGLEWLESGENSVMPLENQYDYYALYGLERVGLASGFKYFGSHDWYRDQSATTIQTQNTDGSWGDDMFDKIVDTSYALLFLARGRHPIIMSKLRFDGDWANRPRDVANLASFASSELVRPLNWQVVTIDRDWHDWTDGRILFLASDKAPAISDADMEKIREYVQHGGLLLMQSDGGSAEFSQFAEDFGRKLFPQYGWADLPAGSALETVAYKLDNPPKIRVISNGARILVMLWPEDVTSQWQLKSERESRGIFELGVDLVLYANGKTELKNRVQSQEIPALISPAASLTLGRIRYDGNWDPEPAAWPHAARWFGQQTSLGLNLQTIDLKDLPTANPPIAHITGTAKMDFTDDQVAAIRQYVQNGGDLVVDPCGIPDAFYGSITDDLLPRAFPDDHPENLDPTSPLLSASADGMEDIGSPQYREYVHLYSDTTRWHIQMIHSGHGHVIILPADLTSGILGDDDWGIAGFTPDYSMSFMKNLILWTWNNSPD